MSQKIANYLEQHLLGEVVTSKDALDFFSTDGSVFTIDPKIVVYPRNTGDVRKVARFTWQLAEKGHSLGITARGKGTDQAGAAIGDGVIVVFPAHMHKVLEIDRESITVQPGIIYSKVEQTLHTHGRFLPPYPSSAEFSTIGGAVANNAAGEKTLKYGQTDEYVQELGVVLANGEYIETKKLNKRQLKKKLGLTNMEGEIYRQIDTLIEENQDIIESSKKGVSKNSAGYALSKVKTKNNFDLTPLFVGSQGTLGIVTQVKLKTAPYNPQTSLLAGFFDNIDKAADAVDEMQKLGPSCMEMVDDHLLDFVSKHNPSQLKGIIEKPYPKIAVLIEFDDMNDRTQKSKARRAKKILAEMAYEYRLTRDTHEQQSLWKLRHSAAAVLWHTAGNSKALPIIEDGVVPKEGFTEYLNRVYALYQKHGLDVAVWGHAGDANLHMQPFLDLSKVGDRQKVFRIADEYYNMVLEMGGSTSGEHNDGRMRAPYLPRVYGKEMYELFRKVKKIFDPMNTMNPGVKIDVDRADLVPMLRREYSMKHLYDHLPKS